MKTLARVGQHVPPPLFVLANALLVIALTAPVGTTARRALILLAIAVNVLTWIRVAVRMRKER